MSPIHHDFVRGVRLLRRSAAFAAVAVGTLALGIALGAGYMFPTTFKNEVYSDLTGERGVFTRLDTAPDLPVDVFLVGSSDPAVVMAEYARPSDESDPMTQARTNALTP